MANTWRWCSVLVLAVGSLFRRVPAGAASSSDHSELGRHAVDGEYDEWSAWSACSVSCSNGTRTRERVCLGQAHDGAPCEGPPEETETCFTKDCPVDGVWTEWTEWTVCSLTCTEGTRTRNRTCDGPFHDGTPCPGTKDETEACTSVEICPVDGVWSEWSVWSACTVTCGNGTRNRNRTCVGQRGAGLDCAGEAGEVQRCGEKCSNPGYFSEWQPWAPCSVTCGRGVRRRTRACVLPSETSEPCVGNSEETENNCSSNGCDKFYATCTELRTLGLSDNVKAEINPTQVGLPIMVTCNMKDQNGVGITEIEHNQPAEIQIQPKGGRAQFDFEYTLLLSEIQSLVDVSLTCRQYIGWKCRNAKLTKGGQLTSYALDTYETPITFFPGGDSKLSGVCACARNNSCSDPTKKCNCDNPLSEEQRDEGYFYANDDLQLPISSFVIGTLDGASTLSVGPLQCYGVRDGTYVGVRRCVQKCCMASFPQ